MYIYAMDLKVASKPMT